MAIAPDTLFQIDRYSAEEAQLFRPLFETVWPSATNRQATIAWAFQSGPFGPGILLGAHTEEGRDQLIAARGSMVWPLRVSGIERPALIHQLHATCVHPNYRRLGAFTALNRRFLDEFANIGGHAIFNISVAASRAGYEKIGWRYLSGLRRYFFFPTLAPVAFGLVMKGRGVRHGRRVELEDGDPLPTWSDVELFHRARQDLLGELHHTRYTEEFYHWRYSRRDVGYRFVLDSKNGWASYRRFRREGRLEVVIGDLWPAEPTRSGLLRLVATVWRRHPTATMSLLASAGHPLTPLLRHTGWIPDPKGDLHLGVRLMSSEFQELVQPRLWAVMAADIDTF